MQPISVVCWKWSRPGYRATFTAEHVNILRDMVRRNTNVPHRFICVTDNADGIAPGIEVIKLWDNPAPRYGRENRPNCFYRLKAFAPSMAKVLGEKFIWLDLDCVITGNIDHLLNDAADFKIWKVDGAEMPCNGSMVLHRAGTRAGFWDRFKPALVCARRGLKPVNGFQGSDQAWIAGNLSEADQFFGAKDGVYSYRLHIRGVNRLPENAAVVFFHGRHNPWDADLMRRFKWISNNYRLDYDIKASA